MAGFIDCTRYTKEQAEQDARINNLKIVADVNSKCCAENKKAIEILTAASPNGNTSKGEVGPQGPQGP